jgi:hypothetical protein
LGEPVNRDAEGGAAKCRLMARASIFAADKLYHEHNRADSVLLTGRIGTSVR